MIISYELWLRRIAKHVWENQLSNVQFDPSAFKQVGVNARTKLLSNGQRQLKHRFS